MDIGAGWMTRSCIGRSTAGATRGRTRVGAVRREHPRGGNIMPAAVNQAAAERQPSIADRIGAGIGFEGCTYVVIAVP